MPTPPQIIVSNSYVSTNQDIPVKVTNPSSEVLPGNVQHVNVDSLPGLNLPEFDYISVAYPTGTQEVYTYKTGGSGGTTVATVTVNYVDSTKEQLSDVTKT